MLKFRVRAATLLKQTDAIGGQKGLRPSDQLGQSCKTPGGHDPHRIQANLFNPGIVDDDRRIRFPGSFS